MALRVLLADESSTIKKVIQLSLQDFGVDVKSVTIGLDVLSVAKTFRPDIVFADVLLAKRSGYEVCHDLKNDPETDKIPVVLMWSGFMEIDEQKARLCGADRRLEKPFDAASIRQMVQELVERAQTNPVKDFFQPAPLPAFEEKKSAQAKQAASQVIPQKPQKVEEEDSILIEEDEIDLADEWVQKPTTPVAARHAPPKPPVSPQEDEFTEFSLSTPPQPQQAPPSKTPTPPQTGAFTGVPEELMRQEIQKWLSQHMPDIAERLIREEINRLLRESEQSIQAP